MFRIKNIQSILKRNFAEIIPSKGDDKSVSTILKPSEMLTEISKTSLDLSPEQFLEAKKTGAELYLTPESKRVVESPGFFFRDANERIDLDAAAVKGWKLQYLKNMLLIQDYNNIFRDFLQSCALGDTDGLNLTCEPRLKDYINANLNPLLKRGYNLEIDSLKIKHDFSVLRFEVYKNLKVNRYENASYSKYNFQKYPSPLGPVVVAHEIGNDHSFAKDQKPFVFAATMLVKSPMKMAIFNQNFSKKIHGYPENETIEYVVRFESEFSYSDFAWVLPTQNKPKRLRQTKIADFNNVLRGNPFFSAKLDLIDDKKRYSYMLKDEYADLDVLRFINSTSQH